METAAGGVAVLAGLLGVALLVIAVRGTYLHVWDALSGGAASSTTSAKGAV